jgi:hypothetical protein
MAELSDHTFFLPSAHPFGAQPELAADELIDALEAALRRVMALPADASPLLVNLAHSTLAALARIRSAGHLACITWHVARELRLHPDDLQSASREQQVLGSGKFRAAYAGRHAPPQPVDSGLAGQA